ncbi:MAG: thiamine pyrophosphate-dependent dehydrogenase E1 component subunit alpha [Nitrospirota bacterium]
MKTNLTDYKGAAKQAGPDVLLGLMRTMLLIRRFEEKIIEVYPVQDMKTPVHLYIGEEAIAAGVCAHLKKEDYLFTTHRSHGHCLAKGSSPEMLYAEFYGRSTGCSKGKGGSMHPVDPENGILGTTAIVGGGIPLAAGTALASKMKKDGKISVTFFGDGASEEGTFHESLNFASLKQLPVIFICENNSYATTSPIWQRQPHDNIAKRASGYNIPGITVDGNSVLEVYEAAGEAVQRARDGRGPTLIECRTYRWKGHVGPDCDHEKGCRPMEDLNKWKERCPVVMFRDFLINNSVITETQYNDMLAEIDREMDRSISAARESAMPEKEELLKDVYHITR